MKKILLLCTLYIAGTTANGQKIDSIFFHLYTDSLKKGQYNYINIDGKMSGGKWMPLTAKELELSSSHGNFSGNELFIPADFKEKKVTVKAVLKNNPAVWKERTIWIKTVPDPDRLPTKEEILNNKPKGKNKNRK